MKFKYNFGYFIAEGFKSIFTHGFMSFAAVCMIVCCLLIMGSFSLVAVNVDAMLGNLEAKNEFTAFIDESWAEEDIPALQAQVEATPNVASVTYVSRGEAMDNFQAEHPDNLLLSGLPDEVLRARFRIHVTDIEQMAATSTQVEGTEGIGDVSVELELAQIFVVIRDIAGAVAIVLVLILLLVSLFIIANTTKLATFNRREEIAIMKMCGATNGFIRWPFVIEGMLLGLTGAVLAFFLQWGVYSLVSRAILGSDPIDLISVLPFGPMVWPVLGIFVCTGLVIGTLGSVLAIRKFLQV